MNELILTHDEWLEAAKASETYHYPNPLFRTIGQFGSGATLKTDGEKIVGRVEAPAFRIGGVYRQRDGTIVQLEAIDPDNYPTASPAKAVRDTLQRWAEHGTLVRAAIATDARRDDGWRRLSDGRYPTAAREAEYGSHLLPGELVQRDGQWVAMEEAPRGRLTGVVVTVGGQSHGFASGDTVTILGGGGSGGSPNTPMLSRDARQPTARERSVMARINLAKALTAEWEAAKKQPALAHPYPFARNFQG